nr:hypothetical protein [Tanacetum cinerariifolium]
MNAILGVYTELDEVTNLQCDYLELLEKYECLEKELSKSKMMSKRFEALQKHAINLEIDLQQCQEKIKMTNLSKKISQKNFAKNVNRVIPTTSVSRPQLKSNPMEDRVMLNNNKRKKQEVENQRRNVKLSKNKTSITACNDSLNVKTLNVNFVCATCGKCVLNEKHDMCVLKSVNGVNSRTKMPIVVPIPKVLPIFLTRSMLPKRVSNINNFQKDQPQVKNLIIDEIITLKSKEPDKALEDEFKDLHLNLPVFEVLAHASMYNALLDKYVESLELGKNGSAFIQGEMPKKIKDPRLFTLSCRLGDSTPFDTLANLGSCVNLIPLHLFKTLNIGLLEETENVLGLTDGSKSYPVGIVRNVEVYLGKSKLLEDFYVIGIEKDHTCPLLVGRGFLATAITVTDCKKTKIAVGEGITRLISEVKEAGLGHMDTPYWTTLAK